MKDLDISNSGKTYYKIMKIKYRVFTLLKETIRTQ